MSLLRPEQAETIIRKFARGEVTLDEIRKTEGEDLSTVEGLAKVKFDRVLLWAPGHGPCPEALPKRSGRPRSFQSVMNFAKIVKSFNETSAKTKKSEAIVAQAVEDTGFSRKAGYAALKIWKRIRWEDDPEFDAALKRIKRGWEDGPELG